MKQKILAFLVIADVIYLWHFHPLWIGIFAIASIISLLVVLFIRMLIEMNKREKDVANYLHEYDEKLKKGDWYHNTRV